MIARGACFAEILDRRSGGAVGNIEGLRPEDTHVTIEEIVIFAGRALLIDGLGKGNTVGVDLRVFLADGAQVLQIVAILTKRTGGVIQVLQAV